jgi:hypothetical protein
VNVVDFQRRGRAFPTKAAALDFGKRLAAANPPSQVVLFDAFGRTETVAHYQLPQYRIPEKSDRNGVGTIEIGAKARTSATGGLKRANSWSGV